jgi:hypothetical protein
LLRIQATREIQANVARQVELNAEISSLDAKPSKTAADRQNLRKLQAEQSMREAQLEKLVEQSALAMKIADAMVCLDPSSVTYRQLGRHLERLLNSMKETIDVAKRLGGSTTDLENAKVFIQRQTTSSPAIDLLLQQAASVVTPFRGAGRQAVPSMLELLGDKILPAGNIIVMDDGD